MKSMCIAEPARQYNAKLSCGMYLLVDWTATIIIWPKRDRYLHLISKANIKNSIASGNPTDPISCPRP